MLTLLEDANKNSYVMLTCLNNTYIGIDLLLHQLVLLIQSFRNKVKWTEDMNLIKSDPASSKLQNSDILKDLDQKLSQIDPVQRKELKQLIHEYEHIFPDTPTRTNTIYHDVNAEDSQPVKQHPYRMNLTKQKYLKEEIQYLLDNDFIEPSQSEWSKSCILVPTPDGTYRMWCAPITGSSIIWVKETLFTSQEWMTVLTELEIQNIGNSKYITKFDLLKGFWQIPLSEIAKKTSAFVTPGIISLESNAFWNKQLPSNISTLTQHHNMWNRALRGLHRWCHHIQWWVESPPGDYKSILW